VVVVTVTGTVVVDTGAVVDVVTGGAVALVAFVVLVVDTGAENATRCDGRSTVSR
jgi:hypothetical protein